jgi:hypothetical protein
MRHGAKPPLRLLVRWLLQCAWTLLLLLLEDGVMHVMAIQKLRWCS